MIRYLSIQNRHFMEENLYFNSYANVQSFYYSLIILEAIKINLNIDNKKKII